MPIIKMPTFNYEELNGKNLRIYTNKSEDGTVVVGIDENTGQMYVLKLEINTETPYIVTTDMKSPATDFDFIKSIRPKKK